MFCPQCGTQQSEELKFCKVCGANMHAVLQVMTTREAEGFEHRCVTTLEERRHTEIKAGVITGSIGLAVSIFLLVFMQGIVLGGKVPNDTAEILSRIWVAGLIPIFIGIALLINGLFVSKRLVQIAQERRKTEPNILGRDVEPPALRSADTTEFIPPVFSVTEETTKHFRSSGQKR